MVLYYNRFVLFLLQFYALDIAIHQLYAHSQLHEIVFIVGITPSTFNAFRSHPLWLSSFDTRFFSTIPRRFISAMKINSCALAQGKNTPALSELKLSALNKIAYCRLKSICSLCLSYIKISQDLYYTKRWSKIKNI